VPARLEEQLDLDDALAALGGLQGQRDVDWTALELFSVGELIPVLLRADAGVMLRSADHGRAVAVGVFVAGRSAWHTCVDQRELLAILHDCVARLEAIAGAARVPGPARKARAARRTS
jgi:hypothetical protein